MALLITDECINCDVCEPECPIEAIYADDELPNNQIEFIEINAKLADVYENITEAKEPLPDADNFKDIEETLDAFLSIRDRLTSGVYKKISEKLM